MVRKVTYTLFKAAAFFVLLILLSSLHYMHLFYEKNTIQTRILVSSQSYSSYNEPEKGFFISTPGCRIPKLDPFGPTVRKYYSKTPEVYNCGPEVPIFIARERGSVEVNETLLHKLYKVSLNETVCTYQPIFRKPIGRKPDDVFHLGKEQPMVFGLPLDDDAILLKCKKRDKTVVSSVLPLTPLKQEVEERCKRASDSLDKRDDKLSVIVVGIDSISKLNFLRYFPKTLDVLRNQLSAIELHGYTKVGDNTYPNLIALLTGRDRKIYRPFEERFGFYDWADFAWKRYSRLGYRTLFSEDAPSMGTFVLQRRGFRDPPTDYYTMPFSAAAEAYRRNSHCIGPTLEMRLYFDHLRNFATTFQGRPIFAFTFAAGLTHDVLRNAGFADRPAFDLVTGLQESGVLNSSVFVFFSDHGIRFGDIRQTYVGKIEERMPFAFLVFPDWYLRAHPDMRQSLRLNRNRLTTHYDVHATLLHLLEPGKKRFFTLHGQSLLTEISPERTCADAGIAKHWCVCQDRRRVPAGDATVRRAAAAVVRHVNRLLKPHARLCATLQLTKILDAWVSRSNEDILVVKDNLITLVVAPSNAVLEATVQLNGKEMAVLDEVSRVNMYGNQSVCLDDSVMKLYCYCKVYMNNHS